MSAPIRVYGRHVEETRCPLADLRLQFHEQLALWQSIPGISVSNQNQGLSLGNSANSSDADRLSSDCIYAQPICWRNIVDRLKVMDLVTLRKRGYNRLLVIPGGCIEGVFERLTALFIAGQHNCDFSTLSLSNLYAGHHEVIWGQYNSCPPLIGDVTEGVRSQVVLLPNLANLKPTHRVQSMGYHSTGAEAKSRFVSLPIGLVYIAHALTTYAAQDFTHQAILCAGSAWPLPENPASAEVKIPIIITKPKQSGHCTVSVHYVSSLELRSVHRSSVTISTTMPVYIPVL